MRKGLCEICSPKQWKTISTDLLTGTRYPVYGANGVIGYYSEYNHTEPTLLITCRGATCGMLNICKPYSYVNGNAMALDNLTPDVNISYLYYYLQNRGFKDVITGSAQPQIVRQSLEKVQIYYPDLQIQTAIVSLLDKVSDLIYLRKQQLAKLDELVKSRFVELFGDVIRNDRGWEQYTFSDIATSRLGKMLDAKQQTGKYAYPYLANFNVQWFRFEIDNLNKMDFNEGDRREFELHDGDLLVCEGGEIGRCAVWHNEIQPCYFQKALHRVRCNQHIVLPDYMAWWFKYNCDHKGFAAIEGAKATIAHLPGAKLKALKVTAPPIEFQNHFVAFLKQTDKSKLAIQQSLDKLEFLKKALMQKYFG